MKILHKESKGLKLNFLETFEIKKATNERTINGNINHMFFPIVVYLYITCLSFASSYNFRINRMLCLFCVTTFDEGLMAEIFSNKIVKLQWVVLFCCNYHQVSLKTYRILGRYYIYMKKHVFQTRLFFKERIIQL